jgi:hypothetical protein
MERVLTDKQYQRILEIKQFHNRRGNRGYKMLESGYEEILAIIKFARPQFEV